MLRHLGLRLPCDLASKLQLVDPATMSKHSHVHQSRDSRSSCQCITGLTLNQKSIHDGKEISRGVTGILMLRGLGNDFAHGVLAHECVASHLQTIGILTLCHLRLRSSLRFMHAFLYSNSYPTLPPLVEEGICELVSALYAPFPAMPRTSLIIWLQLSQSILIRILFASRSGEVALC
jgi:hypothetical protein